jgi:hypothetical protein
MIYFVDASDTEKRPTSQVIQASCSFEEAEASYASSDRIAEAESGRMVGCK